MTVFAFSKQENRVRSFNNHIFEYFYEISIFRKVNSYFSSLEIVYIESKVDVFFECINHLNNFFLNN